MIGPQARSRVFQSEYTLPRVRAATAPFAAGTIEAFNPPPAPTLAATDPVFIEDVEIWNPAEMSSTRVTASTGADRVQLDWLTQTPKAAAVVTLRARNAIAASERVVTVPVPRAATEGG